MLPATELAPRLGAVAGPVAPRRSGALRPFPLGPAPFPGLRLLGATDLHRAAWLIAAILAAMVAVVFQVRQRAHFLIWDEAERVHRAALFASALRSGDPLGAWSALQTQALYPVVASLPHGLMLLVQRDVVVAAWVPTVLAYALAGILVGRLAFTLGGGVAGAWCAAVLYWCIPLELRLAAGSFTEIPGSCLYLLLLLSLLRLQRTDRRRPAVLTGGLVATAFLLKYDYGTLSSALVALTGLGALVARRGRAHRWRQYRAAFIAAILPVLLWFSIDTAHKVQDLLAYALQPKRPLFAGESIGIDFGHYARVLFSEQVGLSGAVALLLAASFVWAVLAARRRPSLRVPVLLVLLWYAMYAVQPNAPKQARYLAPILPVLAALCGVAVVRWHAPLSRLCGRLFPDRRLALAPALLGALAIAWALVLQAIGPGGWSTQALFLRPYDALDDVPALVVDALGGPPEGSSRSTVLLLGQTNELSPGALRISLVQRLSSAAPPVAYVPEIVPVPTEPRLLLVRAIDAMAVSRIVSVDFRPGSRLDTEDFRLLFPSQRGLVHAADELAESGMLTHIDESFFDDGALRVTIYGVPPAAGEMHPVPTEVRRPQQRSGAPPAITNELASS